MSNYEIQESLLDLIHGQSSPDDQFLSSEESLQQHLAHLISENQYLNQQLKDAKKREQKLVEENLRLKTEYEQLNGQKTFLGTLLQQIADGVIIVSRQGKIHYVNEAASALLGRSLEELQEYDLGYPISDGKTEICLHRPDQSTIIAQLRVSKIKWDQHRAYLVSLREITEEKRSQAKLEESETRFRLVANTAPVLIWMTNRQGKLTFVNHSWLKIIGQDSFGLIGSKWLEAIHPDDFTDYWHTYHQAIADQTSFQIQFRLKHPEKGYQWLLNRGVPRLTQEGEFLGFIGSCVDISDYKHLEEHLLKVTQAVACSGEAIAILEQQGTLIYQNPAFEKLFGYSMEEINYLGGIHQLFLKKDNIRLSRGLQAIQAGDMAWSGELTLKGIRGDKQQINLQIDKIIHPNGYLIGLALIATDISERKRAEIQLKQANGQLKTSIKQLATTNREIAQLSVMVKLLQGCSNLEEAYEVLKRQIPQLFCQFSGGLFLQSDSHSPLEVLINWGDDFNSEIIFSTQDCWSLRNSNLHWSLDPNYIPCPHQNQTKDSILETLCIPLSARSESLGMLYLSSKKTKKCKLNENHQQFCQMVAENIAVALSNLKLREQLKQEAIRDPLTHLYNRRYLEVSLDREIARSKRKKQSLSVVMIDIDHFKRINDNFCHAAGDVVLKKLSAYLEKNIRSSDMACRFGGEELTLIFPETTLEMAKKRAEQLRNGIKELNFQFQQQDLGKITASFGVASYPEYSEIGQDVLHIADLALYCAKESGRDCVISADMMLNKLSVR